MARTRPTESFLVSNFVPFQLCGLSGSVTRVAPKLLFDEISQPDPKTEKWELSHMPQIAVDRILDFLICEHLRVREFTLAFGMICLDKRALRQWTRALGDAHAWIRPLQQVRGLGRIFFLLERLNDEVMTATVVQRRNFTAAQALHHEEGEGMVLDEQPMDEFFEDTAGLTRYHYPVVTVENPFWSHRRASAPITPASLVGRGPLGLYTDVGITGYADGVVVFSDFEKGNGVGGWVGRRLCDLMLLDAEADEGVFHTRQVVFPVLLLSIRDDNGTGYTRTAGGWEHAKRGDWHRFADLVEYAFEGCATYMEKANLPPGQWGCRYFQRMGTKHADLPVVAKSNQW